MTGIPRGIAKSEPFFFVLSNDSMEKLMNSPAGL
jgi:hypothetical protein